MGIKTLPIQRGEVNLGYHRIRKHWKAIAHVFGRALGIRVFFWIGDQLALGVKCSTLEDLLNVFPM